MAKYEKPNSVNVIWAVNALAGDIEKPTDAYIQTGWVQVKPPFEYENWSMQKLHQGLAYINQLGCVEWDNLTEYQAGKSYVQSSDNRLYKCIQTHINRDPVAGNTAYWEVFEGNRQATTAARGTVELATNAETQQGTADNTAVTPASLSSRTATTTRTGVIRTATNQEVQQGNVNDAAITPATLQFRQATTNQSGLVELATDAEAQAGSRNDVALTPRNISGIFEALFPVGSVVIRPQNPGSSIGNGGLGFGTWAKIQGRSLMGEGSYTDSNGHTRNWNRGASFGTWFHRLTTNQMPSHSHSASSSTEGAHSHSGNTGYDGVHSHSGYSSTNGNHSHGGTTAYGGSHSHGYRDGYYIENSSLGLAAGADGWEGVSAGVGSGETDTDNNRISYKNRSTNSANSHRHSFSTNTTGNHNHTLNINNAGNHRHSFGTTTNGNHSHNINVGSTGSGSYHENTHPIFAVPIWYRES